MKLIRVEKFGSPSQACRCVEVPDVGAPSAWEVVVDVEACVVNPSDLAIIAGQYGSLPTLPATPGMEGVGRITARGSSVNAFEVGDRVVLVGNDTWTQRRKVPAAAVFKVPAHLDVLQLAMLKVNPATALMLLRHSGPKLVRGDWLLQTAPLSSVGRAVLQLARKFGFRTVNVVRRAETIDEVKAAGGDVVLQDGAGLAAAVAAATRNGPIRLAFDPVGGPGVERVADCLARHATIVNYGMLTREPLTLRADQTIFKGITLKGFWLSEILSRLTLKERDDLFAELVGLLADGTLRGEIAATYPIDEVALAIRHAERQGRRGKVLMLPNGPIPSVDHGAGDPA